MTVRVKGILSLIALAFVFGLWCPTEAYLYPSQALTPIIPVPNGQESFPLYGPIALPIISSDPLKAMPIGLGSVASGGDTISVQIGLGQFSGPVDIYFGYYAPSIDPQNI